MLDTLEETRKGFLVVHLGAETDVNEAFKSNVQKGYRSKRTIGFSS